MKLKKCIAIAIVMIIGLITNVNAQSTFEANVSASKTTLKPGEEVTLTIEISNINMGTNGVNTLEGQIIYDDNVFEEIKSSSIQNLNNWTTTYNDENSLLNGKFLSVNLSSGTTQNAKIFSVKFKAKANIEKIKETKIEIKDITSNDGTDLVNIGNKTITLKIDSGNSDEGNNNEVSNEISNEIDEGNNEIKKENTTQQTNGKKEDNTKSNTKLPKTGRSIAIVSIIGICGLVIMALGIKNRKMKDIK